MREYKAVVRESLDAVFAMIDTGLVQYVTFTEIYRAMCLVVCEVCGNIGNYMYLLQPTRCCWKCILDADLFKTIKAASFSKTTMISEQQLREASVRILLKRSRQWTRGRRKLINHVDAARMTGTSQAPGYFTSREYGLSDSGIGRMMATAPLPFFDNGRQASFRTLRSRGCAVKHEEARSLPMHD